MEIVPFSGWERCARLTMRDLEMVVTLDVGPRIIRYGFVGGPNELVVHDKDAGHTGGDGFHSYGGHRLWIAPEEHAKTLQPDNDPVEVGEDGRFFLFRSRTDVNQLQKEIAVEADEEYGRYRLRHRIYNRGAFDVEFAPWAPTQMAPGGQCIVPSADYASHAERLLPARPLVLWSYTDMSDPRWSWKARVVRLTHDATLGPTKIGMQVEQGYAAYANHGNVFLKRFPFVQGARYPDFGCNFETFTREDMLEVESLGPLQTVAPGGYAELWESWYLVRGESPPADDGSCATWLGALAADRPL